MGFWIGASIYSLMWLLTARLLFGRWRSHGAAARRGDYCAVHGGKNTSYNRKTPRKRPGCCLDEPTSDDALLALGAMVTALVWPGVLLTALVRFRAPATPAERVAREKARTKGLEEVKARNAELERELELPLLPASGEDE
jgi:hypothetical protein